MSEHKHNASFVIRSFVIRVTKVKSMLLTSGCHGNHCRVNSFLQLSLNMICLTGLNSASLHLSSYSCNSEGKSMTSICHTSINA